MSLKLHLLAAAFAFVLTGNAMAGQSGTFFTSFAGRSSSGAKDTSVRQPKSPAKRKIPQIKSTKSFRGLEVYRYGQIADGTFAEHSRNEHSVPPAEDLRIPGNYADEPYQTFAGLGQAREHNYGGGSYSGGFNRGSGHNNQDISEAFHEHFKHGNDYSGHIDDGQYFDCTVSAVPEPGGGLLMLCGLGLIGYFTTVRKRISLFPR